MNKLILFLAFLLIPCILYSADISVGKVIPDAEVLDSAFYKTSKIGIPVPILQGRAIVDAHRKRKRDSYKTEMVHADRVATNVNRLFWVRVKLQGLGFKNEGDLITQSREADKKAGLPIKEWWK